MRVCVIGCSGYLGSMLTPELMRRQYDVVGIDTGFYNDRALYQDGASIPMTVVRDLRLVEQKDLEGLDAIVHMAELSNDPLGELAPNITYEINHQGSVRLAQLAKRAGVKRFVYMSSCSVYGIASEEFVDEESPVNPQTAYGECKMSNRMRGDAPKAVALRPESYGRRFVLSYFLAQRHCFWSIAAHAV